MNTIEQLVEALKRLRDRDNWRVSPREKEELGNDWVSAEEQGLKAIAAGEAELRREPDGYIAWEDGKPSWDEDCVCEDAAYPADEDDTRTSMPFYVRRESK